MKATLPAELASRVVWFCSHRNVQNSETVVDKGSTCNDIYIISRGQFKVHDASAGEEFVLAVLQRGDIFGEMSFLDGSVRSASVTATCGGSLLKMGKDEFSAMLHKEPETAIQFLRFLAGIVSGRLRQANNALLELAFSDEETCNTRSSQLQEAISEMHAAVRIELEDS